MYIFIINKIQIIFYVRKLLLSIWRQYVKLTDGSRVEWRAVGGEASLNIGKAFSAIGDAIKALGNWMVNVVNDTAPKHPTNYKIVDGKIVKQ